MNHLPIAGRRIRFAVVGCGRVAENYFHAPREHAENAKLVAMCDTDKTALDGAVSTAGARGIASLTELLESADADVVARSGALGSIEVTMPAYPKNFEGSMTILAETGTVRLGGLPLNEAALPLQY